MTTTLNVQESGRVKYVRRPGAMLEAGCVVARLELDDPSKVRPVCDTWHGHPVSRTGRWLRPSGLTHPDGRRTVPACAHTLLSSSPSH